MREYLDLQFKDTTIQMIYWQDSLEVTIKNATRKYYISNAERDTLFMQANKLIDSKENTIPFCTDYAGRLKLQIRYNQQVMKEVSFISICDWRELDSNTRKIDQLLTKIFGNK
jgi:hypothetical protein